MKSPLILGTAQLGLPYGIANASGKPSQADANEIVRVAWEDGVVFYDTAMAYGESERVLGLAFRAAGILQPNIITKLMPTLSAADAPDMPIALTGSLQRLGVKKLYAVFLHREEQIHLLDGPVGSALTDCLADGIAERIGVSVYSTEGAVEALQHSLVSCIQIPSSLFDRRFENAGIFKLAQKLKKEIHVRSVLLQGVLAMNPNALPCSLLPLRPFLSRYQSCCEQYAVDPAPMALAWAVRRYAGAKILFGAELAEQVRNNMAFQNRWPNLPSQVWEDLEEIIPPQLPELLNPSNWK